MRVANCHRRRVPSQVGRRATTWRVVQNRDNRAETLLRKIRAVLRVIGNLSYCGVQKPMELKCRALHTHNEEKTEA